MKPILITAALFCVSPLAAFAHMIDSPAAPDQEQAFDIKQAGATTDGKLTTFVMDLFGQAGTKRPMAIGQLPGAKVFAYVWPTKLDPSVVGFDVGSGILSLAVTSHPDFDDTPLFDENGDGDPANDGKNWHSHWVVLGEDKACGAGLKVRDVSPGVDMLPQDAPGLPIALSSPGMSPLMNGTRVKITMPIGETENVQFDAVTAELQVHQEGKTPLLCVKGVYDIASGDLSMPGVIIKR